MLLLSIAGIALIGLVYIPSLWVQYMMHRYSTEIPELPGTGAELARHLIDRFELEGVTVEETIPNGDHYSPNDRCVRLSPNNYHGKSLTAVAVSAHEIGHAIQFDRQETTARLRTKYMPFVIWSQRIGVGCLFAMPIILAIVRIPHAAGIMIALSFFIQLISALTYLLILPEEWDASFNKALPILIEGEYINEDQQLYAYQILRAAALTYFAGALADIVRFSRWMLILRR
jgi:Zn-dependent membrane protease YugP